MSLTISVKRLAVLVSCALAVAFAVVLLRQDTGTSAPAAAAAPASPISGSCQGLVQGQIKGSATGKGRVGTYSISALAHGVGVPVDPSSGQATGRRQHKPITFTMRVDKSTPQLITALVDSERLTSCAFGFWRRGPGDTEQKYLTIRLENAQITSYSLTARPGGADDVTFQLTYQQITWTYLDGGITAEDDWESGVS